MQVDKELLEEFQFYKMQSEGWKKENNNKFVLIMEQSIYGIYESYVDALSEGVKNFGAKKFLIQQVGSENIVNSTTLSLIGAI